MGLPLKKGNGLTGQKNRLYLNSKVIIKSFGISLETVGYRVLKFLDNLNSKFGFKICLVTSQDFSVTNDP
jgi:hypothetical protein